MSKLRDEVSKLESERDALKAQLSSANSSTTTTSKGVESRARKGVESDKTAPPTTSSSSDALAEHLVHEERLKWQVEVSKVRRELGGQLEGERKGQREERDALRQEVRRLEEELAKGKSSRGQLEKSQQR